MFPACVRSPSEVWLLCTPPYNHRQYAASYHVLKTIARWGMDRFDPYGITGRCSAEEKPWGFWPRSMIAAAFRRLFERINSEFLLFSYNIEDLLSKEELLGLFEEYCTSLSFAQIKFRRFRADIDCENRSYKTEHTREFLDLGRPKR